jgi:hypothetical protein
LLLQARVSTLLLLLLDTHPLLLVLLSKPLLFEVKLAVKEDGSGNGFNRKAQPPASALEKEGCNVVR